MNKIIFLNDERVRKILCQENNDPLVDLLHDFPKLRFDLTRHCVQKQSKSISYGRMTIAKMLYEAESFLPSNIRFLIKECHRPLSIQKQFWER